MAAAIVTPPQTCSLAAALGRHPKHLSKGRSGVVARGGSSSKLHQQTHGCTYVCRHMHARARTQTYERVRARTRTWAHTRGHTHVGTHSCARAHTYTHTNTQHTRPVNIVVGRCAIGSDRSSLPTGSTHTTHLAQSCAQSCQRCNSIVAPASWLHGHLASTLLRRLHEPCLVSMRALTLL